MAPKAGLDFISAASQLGVTELSALARWDESGAEGSDQDQIRWAELEAELSTGFDSLFPDHIGKCLYPPEKLVLARKCTRSIIELILDLASMQYDDFIVQETKAKEISDLQDLAEQASTNSPEVCRSFCVQRFVGAKVCIFAARTIESRGNLVELLPSDFYTFLGTDEWRRAGDGTIKVGSKTKAILFILTHPHQLNGASPPNPDNQGSWGEVAVSIAVSHLNDSYNILTPPRISKTGDSSYTKTGNTYHAQTLDI
jgi:hypothetical protein